MDDVSHNFGETTYSDRSLEDKTKKPAYWIGILALVGGIIGYAVSRSTGWLGTGLGIVLGILIGALVYALQTRQA